MLRSVEMASASIPRRKPAPSLPVHVRLRKPVQRYADVDLYLAQQGHLIALERDEGGDQLLQHWALL
jgi:hypothetical protein